MNLAFLFPGKGPYEALDTWVRTLARHSLSHKVTLARTPEECAAAEVVFILTEANTFPRAQVDRVLADLRFMMKLFAVVHNHDNPGVPSLGAYPSFCWTKAALRRLAAYHPWLVRQPLFPPVVPFKDVPLHVATFGAIEWKKHTLEMADWARNAGVRFTAFGPRELCEEYREYIKFCRVEAVLYPWKEKIEDLAPLFEYVSHFLFVLPPSKEGTGGSATSPRYAGFFHRPIIVVDDEETFRADGFHVFRSLKEILDVPRELGSFVFSSMGLPCYDWGPDAYLDELVKRTLAFWDEI